MSVPSNSLRLFGAFQLVCQDKPIVLDQPRLEELIALLAIQPGEPIQRAQIAYQIWPDSSETQARANLRNLLYKLKRLWPDMDMDNTIAVERNHVTWRRDAGITVDLIRFGSLIAEAGRCDKTDDRIKRLTDAVDLYRGDFLPNCFADWVLVERERQRSQYAAILEQLIDALLERRRNEEALQRAKALQRFDPLHESAYRCLMQTYAALGDRAAALRVYHTCASTLQQELGVEPSPATEAFRTQLLHLETLATAPDAQSGAPQAVQRQRLVGRHDEWRQVKDAWRHVQQGGAKCILIWGEAGIGKTRLAEELINWAQHQDQITASSRSYAVEGALTYAPIAEWLRAPAIQSTLESIDDLWRVEIARLLPELLANRSDLPQPGPMTETWQQQRFFQSIVHALQVAPTPLLLHLDDLQWSDAETLTLLQFLLHGARAHPLLFVGGIRSEDAGSNQALAAFIEAMRHGGQLIELFLGPLSADEAEQLAMQTAGKAIDSDVIDALFAASEGHPLYVIEAVRSEQVSLPSTSTRLATPVSEIHRTSGMPDRIYNLLSARLGQLSPTALQVASLAAVIGHAFSYDVLEAAASVDELSLIDALDELWSRRIIREQVGDSYDFSHDRIREVAYLEISRARRRLYHRQVAAALETIHVNRLDDVAGELAAHYARSGDSVMAHRYYRQAADVALTQHALRHAEEMIKAALLYVSDNPAQRIELLQIRDQVFNLTLDLERWGNNLDDEQTILETMALPDQRLAMVYELSRSRYWTKMNEGKLAVEAAQRALSLAREIGDDVSLASSYKELGNALWRQADMHEASRAFEQMALHAHRAGDRTLEGKALASEASVGMFSGMPANELFDCLTRALAIARKHEDKAEMVDLYAKFGYARTTTAMGQFVQIEQDYRRGLHMAGEISDRSQESILWSSQARFFTNSGNYRRAEESLLAARAVDNDQPILWRNWVTLQYLGALRMQTGRLESARAKLVMACEQLSQTGSHHYEVKARCDLGLVHYLAGDQEQARSELDRALTLLDGYGDLRFEALANTRLGYVLEAMGQLAEASTCYGRGRELHDQMGQHYYAMNALAGLARVAALQCRNDAALADVETVWTTIAGQEMDATVETARTLRTCYTIFDAHDDPRAFAVLEMALDQLNRRASTIDDPEHVAQFWQLDDHRFFQEIAATAG